MHKIVWILFFPILCFSQSRKLKNAECFKVNNISEVERLTNFPFSKSDKIKIISFKDRMVGGVGDELQNHINSIKIKQDTFNFSFYDEVMTLDSLQINKLTDIIYNYRYKKKPYLIRGKSCYMPRNAIFFLDKNNIIISYIEICFECEAIRTSETKLNLGEYCSEKYDLIKSIFQEKNIKYGITEFN
ncbi:hypothetical protein [Flavobacterium sp. N2270]|uniref:hypothetical protein n=1 Tax=Flavobacterium sp. N2270 TaxID=2986831 RepID=UPI0022257F01|nr:hypothetical protein [Flavobacterium sp. N2270]